MMSEIEDPNRECQHKDIVHLMEREKFTYDNNQDFTSKGPKPSWCKHPSWDSEIDLHEYEWGSFSKPSKIYLGIDVIHTYDDQPSAVNEPDSSVIKMIYDLSAIEENHIDFDSLVASKEEIHIFNLESSTSLAYLSCTLILLIDQ